VSSTCITVTIITEKVMAHLRPEPIGASLTAVILDQPGGPSRLEYTTPHLSQGAHP
jgi:hypothetical protein